MTKQAFSFKTDFRNKKELKVHKRLWPFISQPSQVHEYVVQHFLSVPDEIRGINFTVKDPIKNLIEIQIQITKWDRFFKLRRWKRVCNDLSKKITTRMTTGICSIQPI